VTSTTDELSRGEIDDEIGILKPSEPRGHAGEQKTGRAARLDEKTRHTVASREPHARNRGAGRRPVKGSLTRAAGTSSRRRAEEPGPYGRVCRMFIRTGPPNL
jgi:hypothetical protein